MPRTEFRHPRWMIAAGLGAAAAMSAAAFAIHDSEPLWVWAVFVGLGCLGLLASADAATAALTLGPRSLSIRSNFRRREIPRAEIDRVASAAGCPVMLLLKNGTKIPLPSFGESNQGLVNSIRGWLRVTEAGKNSDESVGTGG